MSFFVESYLNEAKEEILKEQKADVTDDMVFEETFQYLSEKNKVINVTKAGVKKRLMNQSVLQCAKEANDPMYAKYVKATNLRKQCRETLRSKYQSQARKKMMGYLTRKKENKSK